MATSVEDYLIDMVNAKYARRVMQKMNTEYERLTIERGSEPGVKEYEWMLKKAMDIHKQLNLSPDLAGDSDAEKAKD